MRKQRFRLSHMIPNAWFYRLRDMNMVTTPHNNKPSYSSLTSKQQNHPRNSFCYTPKLHQLHTSPIPTSNTINKHALGSIYTQPTESTTHTPTSSCYESPSSESTRSFDGLSSTSCNGGMISSSTTDVIIELNEKSYAKKIQDSSGYELIQEFEFQKPPPIITKPKKNTLKMVEKKEETCSESLISIKIVKESISKKETVSGVEIRSNSSKKERVCKRIVHGNNDHKRQKNNQNNLSDGCCIVKSSFDPQKDFKESMAEMIAENNIRASNDLEKLLACYLSLNSNEYHDTIIKAFEQIWLTSDFVV